MPSTSMRVLSVLAAAAVAVGGEHGRSLSCEFPGRANPAGEPGRLDAAFTCMPGTVGSATLTTSSSIDAAAASAMRYVDSKTTVYDMAPVASFVDAVDGRVRAAIVHRDPNTTDIAAVSAQTAAPNPARGGEDGQGRERFATHPRGRRLLAMLHQ